MKKLADRRPTFFVFSVLFVFALASLYYEKPSKRAVIHNILEIIPLEDKKTLTCFFHQLMFQESFAFILLGRKPMGTAVYNQFIPNYLDNDINRSLKNGWATWQKWAHLFPHPKFIFRTIGDPEEDRFIKIVLINKKTLARLFDEYSEIYEPITGHPYSPSTLIHQLNTNENPIEESFAGHHELIGLAHGYGLHNSHLFQKRHEKMQELQSQHRWVTREDLAADLEIVEPKMRLLEDHSFSQIRLPIFAIDPDSQETHALIETYHAERQMIEATYQEGDFLEITLDKLISTD